MRKSLKREYELKHKYDFADFDTQAGRDFTKKSSQTSGQERTEIS